MSTKTIEARVTAALRRRIQQFYEHLNHRDFEKCYSFLDPTLRKAASSITLYQYASSLERFLNWCGAVSVLRIDPIQLHLDEPSRQYGNRDFAVLEVGWEDRAGQDHTFKERWVREPGGRWYTRCTGMVTPAAA